MVTPELSDATGSTGLSNAEAARRLAEQGPNELPASQRRGAIDLLRDIVSEPMFLLLVACGVIYLLLGDLHDALMLLGFVIVVMAITFVQERRSERSLDALRDLSSPRALVLREGQPRRIAGRDLVVGDLVLLAEGDRVPADMTLLEAANLAVDESLLTGESAPVLKHAGDTSPVASGAPADADDPSRALAGTLVTSGTGTGRVTATGVRSALGRIGHSLQGMAAQTTPIQQETRQIVKRIAVVGMVLATVVGLAYWAVLGNWLQGLLAGLTLAMAILPEELPVVLTLFLGLGAWRLAREQVLARSIPAVELLGATTVLCVDKTGTLTANRMVLRRVWTPGSEHDERPGAPPLAEDLHATLEYAVLACHRRAYDPMESAIIDAGQRLLAGTEHLHADWTLVDDYPLSTEMLAMSRVWQSPDHNERLIAAKGAPEAIVDLCHLDSDHRAAVAAQVSRLAEQGLRVLGVAQAGFAASELPGNQHDFDFRLLGLIGLEDPVRDDVPAAIAECRAAGIRVVMMTGDHPATALSVARQAGLPIDAGAISGSELAQLSDADLQQRLATASVFCRVQPEQKLRLVNAYRACGDIVAMTGDGVNDGPALKAAHIGVAMGARGSEVAREAAALVLLNDDFGSIVTAVRYGRRVFANLRKAIVFVVAVHVPIVGLSVAPLLFGWPMLLMPVHILFLQLIIDPACSVVFEAEALEAGAMTRPPRPASARLFAADVLWRGLWQGLGLLLILLASYVLARQVSGSDDVARALCFSELVLANLALIHVNRRWLPTTWQGKKTPSNQAFVWVGLVTVLVLALVLGWPAVGELFAFGQPSPAMLAAGAAAVALAWGWFEAVKGWMVRRGA